MFYLIFLSVSLVLPAIVFGQVTYSPLIEGGGLNTANIGSYINSLYLLSISIAALLATIKLIIAGAKYMLSDVVTTQGEAKKEIQSSLLGLLLVISAVLILTIINPRLITNELNITPVEPTRQQQQQSAASPAQTGTSAVANSFSGPCGAGQTGPDPSDPSFTIIVEDYTQCPSRNMGTASPLRRECDTLGGRFDDSIPNRITCRYPRQTTPNPNVPMLGRVINTSRDNPIDFSIFSPADRNILIRAQRDACVNPPNFGSWPLNMNSLVATCSLPDVIEYPGNDWGFAFECRTTRNGTYRPAGAISYCTGCLGLTPTCSYRP